MKEKLEKFIKDNDLTFVKGYRNSELVVICGYAQYIEMTGDDLADILKPYFKKDAELELEFNRVWDYTYTYSYSKWWLDEGNRSKYVL